jgi:putative transport protein
MNWLFRIHTAQPVAHAIGVLALVCVVGMALGSLKVRRVDLGTAGVLFAGILTGYFGKPGDLATLEFVKEFGLILFVFTIGSQLGPGFLAALRQQDMALNALAATIFALGALMAPILGWLLGIDPCHCAWPSVRRDDQNTLLGCCTADPHDPARRFARTTGVTGTERWPWSVSD